MLEVNGWQLFAHPLFLDQLEKLITTVEFLARKDPDDYRKSASAKVLAAIEHLAFVDIPQDPTRPDYRQRGTLGRDKKHWFRAKFGNGRFRLFFRFDSKAKVIIFAWVNDETTLRTYGAKTDAYAVFRKMLDKDNPPDDWTALLAEAAADAAKARFRAIKT